MENPVSQLIRTSDVNKANLFIDSLSTLSLDFCVTQLDSRFKDLDYLQNLHVLTFASKQYTCNCKNELITSIRQKTGYIIRK